MSWTGANHRGGGFGTAGRLGPPGNSPEQRDTAQNDHPRQTSRGSVAGKNKDSRFDRFPDRDSSVESVQQHEQRPSPPTSSLENKANAFPRRLFRPNSILEDQNHPDDLLNEIPEHSQAVADFNSNSPSRPPFRDLPSLLISYLANPEPGPHPDWRTMLMRHVTSSNAIQPLSNVQDLYLWVVRVGIPNAIIDNRRYMLNFYLRNHDASEICVLRYDDQPPRSTYIPLDREPQATPPNAVPNHSIFQKYETPRGERFVQWLATPIHVPAPNKSPWQLAHDESALDDFLCEAEKDIRQIEAKALLSRTEGVLKTLWYLWMRNRELFARQEAGWQGMEKMLG